MFLEMNLPLTVHMSPQHLDVDIADAVRAKAATLMIRCCSLQHGKVIAVLDVHLPNPMALTISRTGCKVVCRTMCRVLTQQMYLCEVTDAVVTHVSKIGIFCTIGSMITFVAVCMLPEGFLFQTVPSRMTDGRDAVMPGSIVRVRCMGMRQMAREQYVVASMRGAYLGVVDAAVDKSADGCAEEQVEGATKKKRTPSIDDPVRVRANQTIDGFFGS